MPTEAEYTKKLFRENPKLKNMLNDLRDYGVLHKADELKDDEEAFVVGGPDPRGIEGSKQYNCSCGAVVWLSPSTQDLMARVTRTKISCFECALTMIQVAKKVKLSM